MVKKKQKTRKKCYGKKKLLINVNLTFTLALFQDLHENDGVSFLLVTHSKEVAAFANRSLELRDGRFVAEHGESIDVENLTKDRELIIDETGTVTLPPDNKVPPITGARKAGNSQSNPKCPAIDGIAAPILAVNIIPATAAKKPESIWQ